MNPNEYAQRMRDEAQLTDTVVEWGPGWSLAGRRSMAEQDDGEACLAVHAVDFGETIASIELAEIFPDIGRGHTHAIGIELTKADVIALRDRLNDVLAPERTQVTITCLCDCACHGAGYCLDTIEEGKVDCDHDCRGSESLVVCDPFIDRTE